MGERAAPERYIVTALAEEPVTNSPYHPVAPTEINSTTVPLDSGSFTLFERAAGRIGVAPPHAHPAAQTSTTSGARRIGPKDYKNHTSLLRRN